MRVVTTPLYGQRPSSAASRLRRGDLPQVQHDLELGTEIHLQRSAKPDRFAAVGARKHRVVPAVPPVLVLVEHASPCPQLARERLGDGRSVVARGATGDPQGPRDAVLVHQPDAGSHLGHPRSLQRT